MKTKSRFAKLWLSAAIITCSLAISSKAVAQDQSSTDLKEFKITIEKTDKGLKMQSHQGSAWIDLSFSLVNNKPQMIDEWGMTRPGKVSTIKDPEMSDYLFTIAKTNDGISLTGIEGTAWNELSFSLQENAKQSIDQFGMTE